MLKLTRLATVVLIGMGGVLSLSHTSAWAQAQPSQHTLSAGPAYASKDGQDGPQFPSVDVVVRLTDSNGAFQTFAASDLKLYSGNTELGSGKSIRKFADTGYGVKAILVLDASGSMRGAPLNAIHSSVARFVNQERDQDRVAVLTIADDTRIDVPFRTGKQALAERIQQVQSRGSLTRLYDGLLDAMAQFDSAPPERRQLVVISDGHDEGSRHSIDEVIRQARVDKVSIDSIGLTRSHPEFLQTLIRISQLTGGSFAQAKSPQQLDGLIDDGIQTMRSTPVVAFNASKLDSDGKKHTLDLHWQLEKLSASVELVTPLIAQKTKRTSWYWMPVVWVLLGCFMAGAVLLVFARRRSRRKPITPSVRPSPAPTLAPAIAPSVSYRSGDTVLEEYVPAPQEDSHEYAAIRKEIPLKPRERAKTRLATFFDTTQGHGASLEVTAGPLAGEIIPVTGDFSIGAIEGNQLTIPNDPTLSSFHARILLSNSVLAIEDLRSTNGTFVNGVRLEQDRKLLKPNDEIRMGQSIFRIRNCMLEVEI